MEKGYDGPDGVATLELHGERMFGQSDASRLLVGLQGRLKKRAKMSGSRRITHVTSKREM